MEPRLARGSSFSGPLSCRYHCSGSPDSKRRQMASSVPDKIPQELEARLRQAEERLASLGIELAPELAASAPRVMAISEFVSKVLTQHARSLVARLEDRTELAADELLSRLDLAEMAEPEAMAALRRLRQVEMARIAWRDLAGWADLDVSLRELSTLADAMVRAAVAFAADRLETRFGRPRKPTGEPASLLVLGMGKLGGRELNYSSDIDVVFLYPDGVVLEGRDEADVEEYFRRLSQQLIRLLDQVTEDGFVFRVDARLRPFGASGPLALSISAFESYLIRHGRDWERYAYVKARLVTGTEYESELFDEILTPFVYRRYLDYGVFDALRTMKRLISQEVARKEMEDNIKLGPGGIREIEFVAQVFQLIRGGRVPALRTRSLLEALPLLAQAGQISAEVAERLITAYRYLRTVENRLQCMDDRQTHELPHEVQLRSRIVYAMRADDWASLLAAVDAHRATVESQFNRIAFDSDETAAVSPELEKFRVAWESGSLAGSVAELPEAERAEVERQLSDFRGGGLYRRMDEISRQRLAAVIARIVPELTAQSSPALTLTRVLPILQAICRRSAYLALLDENPMTLRRLLTVAGHSPMLARQITEHPLLLDELLDARLFDAPPSRAELARSLAQLLEGVRADDLEAKLDAMRQFQRAAVFRIAVADRFGGLPIMRVSDRLTDTAELVLELALAMARSELEAKHGRPLCGDPHELRPAGFAIVGYGKLGGLELGYGSDLDLVFLHDSSGAHQETDGEKPIDNARFFARLAQRLIHFLSIQTSSGRLYEVDTRLRPSGESGPIVSSIESFGRYQRKEAWTWEHQALLRSRSVAGEPGLCAAFERDRIEVLVDHVARETLKDEVAKMRARMRNELSRGSAASFDLKQDPGGLADIEFLIDYWVLANAGEYAELVEYPDNIRQLEALERVGLVAAEDCRGLREAYLTLRRKTHELALAEAGRIVEAAEFADLRDWVLARWRAVFGSSEVS